MADLERTEELPGGYQGGKRVYATDLSVDPYVTGFGYVIEVLPLVSGGAAAVYRATMTHRMYGTEIISILPVDLDFGSLAEAEAGARGFFEALRLHPAYANIIELGYIPQPVAAKQT